MIAAVGARAKIEALPEARGAEKLDVGMRVVLPGASEVMNPSSMPAVASAALKLAISARMASPPI